jgi:transposase
VTRPYNPRARGGQATTRRYGGVFADIARETFIANRLKAEGLDPTQMSPEMLAAFRKQALRDSAAKARAALALKRALAKAEREAEAEAYLTKKNAEEAAREARRAARAAAREERAS